MCTRFVLSASVLIDLYLSRLNTVIYPRRPALKPQLAKFRSAMITISRSVNPIAILLSLFIQIDHPTMVKPRTRSSDPKPTENEGIPEDVLDELEDAGETPADAGVVVAEQGQDDEQEEEKEEEAAPEKLFQPSGRAYAIPVAYRVKPKTVLYKRRPTGLGVVLKDDVSMQPVLVSALGDCYRFCERTNRYGIKLTSLVMGAMRQNKDEFSKAKEEAIANGASPSAPVTVTVIGSSKKGSKGKHAKTKTINTVGEKEVFDAIIIEEATKLIKLGALDGDHPNQRQRNVIWKIWTAFNQERGVKFNPELDKVALAYIKLRLGAVPFDGDELQAAFEAVKTYYCDNCSDATPSSTLNQFRDNGWTMPVVLALNDYFKGRELPPISFSEIEEELPEAIEQRATHSKSIWIGNKRAMVESRDSVAEELLTFAQETLAQTMNDYEPFTPVLNCTGEPPEDVKPPPRKRSKYSLCY